MALRIYTTRNFNILNAISHINNLISVTIDKEDIELHEFRVETDDIHFFKRLNDIWTNIFFVSFSY